MNCLWFDKEVGNLDCLINAAGINVAMRSMKELEPELGLLININLTVVTMCRSGLERRTPKKLIILINSVGKKIGTVGGIGYNMLD